MSNRLYTAALVCMLIGLVFWIFSSGILERFRAIEAQCVVNGLGKVSIQHQYTNTSEKSILIIDDQKITKLLINKYDDTLQLRGSELQGKLNLETTALFITLGNKSYSGKCKIKQFSM